MATEEYPERLMDVKVLIVDDEPDILASVQQALQAEGALTQCCSDGNSAVHICESEAPDLIVLDMMLPKRSGFLVLERVKQLDSPPYVIMVTANEGRRHQAYAESLGADAYLHKPLRLERIITLAAEMIEKHGRPTEGRASASEDAEE